VIRRLSRLLDRWVCLEVGHRERTVFERIEPQSWSALGLMFRVTAQRTECARCAKVLSRR